MPTQNCLHGSTGAAGRSIFRCSEPGLAGGADLAMKQRKLLSAAEVAALVTRLEERLEAVGVPSQPEVALRLLETAGDPNVSLNDFAKLIKRDQAVAGRVLRLSNSALFGQRVEVTSLERACVVLGLERLKAVALGFHLSRAAVGHGGEFSRRVWGQSVYRACLAAELARQTAPMHVPEAFVVGLMLDAGLGLMARLAGEQYTPEMMACTNPTHALRLEMEGLEFTHVDVVVALARKWRLPELLARPIELHHTRPSDLRRPETAYRLHRVAYVVGLMDLGGGAAPVRAEAVSLALAERVLDIEQSRIASAIEQSVREYDASLGMFAEVAERIRCCEDLVELAQRSLVKAVDLGVEQSLRSERMAEPARLVIGGHGIEVVRDIDGADVAYLYDSTGQRLLAHRFPNGTITPRGVCEALGVEASGEDDLRRIEAHIRTAA